MFVSLIFFQRLASIMSETLRSEGSSTAILQFGWDLDSTMKILSMSGLEVAEGEFLRF